eukprot:TRINITY_DN15219_c0_g1_i2.p2 TRINITY_DN15219_c0_g1~~TRINITY_DN15219_c0_g1_i2.p2  ORF type:complete len:107 (-),score=19.95 TRINITY_DN15219_c0_g1_i2:270-590(-)
MGSCSSTHEDAPAPSSKPQAPTESREQNQQRPPVSFFVVGDIGAEGAPRRAVARAMADMMMGNDECQPSFVLATGDNFYKCKSSGDFVDSFECLKEEMLEVTFDHD